MNSIFDIRVQKLFAVALVLKVGASIVGWKFQDPWVLGFTVPLLIMCAYIGIGSFRHDNEVTDEKFADSCYYLGFIFTITSIIISLFDLQHIGTRIQDIGVRFGAAMVSTVLGLGVRVYLVSFKKDVTEAIKDAEDAVLDATRKFTEQLTVALERLRDFEAQVDTAAKTSVERVNLQVESLSKNHADKLSAFFSDLTNKNQEAFTSALAEVKSSSQKLAEAVDGYSMGMRSNLASIEAKVGTFTDAVTERLKTTTFPDDYFAQHLRSPLEQLTESSAALALGIKGSLQEVTESTAVLSSALKKLQNKAGATESSLEAVLRLTQQQQAVLDTAQGQMTSLEQLGNTLKTLDGTLEKAVAGVVASSGVTAELTARVGGFVSDGADTRRSLETALGSVTETLKEQVQVTSAVVKGLDNGAAASRELSQRLVEKLDASAAAAQSVSTALTAATTATTAVVGRLDAATEVDVKAVQTLDALGRQAGTIMGRVDGVIEQLQSMVRQLAALDTTLRARVPDRSGIDSRTQGAGVGQFPSSTAPGSGAISLVQSDNTTQPAGAETQPRPPLGELTAKQPWTTDVTSTLPAVPSLPAQGSDATAQGEVAGRALPATGAPIPGPAALPQQAQLSAPVVQAQEAAFGRTASQQPPSP